MLRDEPSHKAREWLGEGSPPDQLAYIVLATLGGLGCARGQRVHANLRTVTRRLGEDPEYWRALIRARDWRSTVIGCSAVLLSRDRRFFGELLDHFKAGSWVAPQLAVALGLIHPAESKAELERLMRQQEDPPGHKTIFSAYAALKRIGSHAALEFETSELFRRSQDESPGISSPAYHGGIAIRLVNSHWDFWKNPELALDAARQARGERGD